MTSRFFGQFLTPSSHVVTKGQTPLKYYVTNLPPPLKDKQTSNFKRNMFRINSIVVHVEGENNYMSKNSKCPGYFIRILLELPNEVT